MNSIHFISWFKPPWFLAGLILGWCCSWLYLRWRRRLRDRDYLDFIGPAWMTGNQIHRAIEFHRARLVSFAGFYMAMKRLENQGKIERRIRRPTESEREVRGDNEIHEFRLPKSAP